VKQLAAQLGSSLGISAQPQPTPVASAPAPRPVHHGASSTRPLPQHQQPQGTAGGEPRLMLPKSGADEALLPMAMGQAFVWKQWEGTACLKFLWACACVVRSPMRVVSCRVVSRR
jgi:hypothetical protein